MYIINGICWRGGSFNHISDIVLNIKQHSPPPKTFFLMILNRWRHNTFFDCRDFSKTTEQVGGGRGEGRIFQDENIPTVCARNKRSSGIMEEGFVSYLVVGERGGMVLRISFFSRGVC